MQLVERRGMSRLNSLHSSAFLLRRGILSARGALKSLPVLWLLFLIGCQSSTESGSQAGHDSAAMQESAVQTSLLENAHYVDDKLCADCHQEIYDSYQHVGMARSFYNFDSTDTIEQFDDAHYYHKPSDNHYEISIVDGLLQQKRYKLRPDGTKAHVHSVSAQYVVGSGNHVRTYLHRNEIGELFQLPIVWYSQDKKWGMAPGYDEATHPDFSRPIMRQCMACHNAYPELPKGADEFGAPHRFPAKLPQGIGCQRCHGPGSEHVRISDQADVKNQDDLQAVLGSIVNSAKLSPKLQDDVCNQCHLQPMSRRTSFVRQFGHGDFDFQPGQSLAKYMVFFEPAPNKHRIDEFEINHHPYRLHQSKCFSQTPGGIRCTHCHDPHRKVALNDRPKFYRQKCFACHQSQDCKDEVRGRAPDANCIACHMPERRTEDVIHVTMTDHKIVRRPSLADPLAALAEQAIPVDDPIRPFQWNSDSSPPEKEVLLQLFAQLLDDDEDKLGTFANELQEQPADQNSPRLLLLQKQLQNQQYDSAYKTFESLDPAAAQLSISQTNAGIAAIGNKDFLAAIQHFQAAIDVDAENPTAWFNAGIAEARLGNDARAVECWKNSIELRPSYVKPRLKLGSRFALLDRLDQAREEFQIALQNDVRNVEAYRKLGSVHRLSGAWKDAVDVLKDGLKIEPDNQELLGSLVLTLLEPGNRKARDQNLALETAAHLLSISDSQVDSLLLNALALLDSGQARDSLLIIQDALPFQNRKPETGLLLAIAQKMNGSVDAANTNYEGAKTALSQKSGRDRLSRVIAEYSQSFFADSE